jgi:hypothetical protein
LAAHPAEGIPMVPATAPDTGAIRIRIVDGTRRPLPGGTDTLVRILDGRHVQVRSHWITQSSVLEKDLPFHDNPDDRYTVFAHSKGYEDAAIFPVRLKEGGEVPADLMVLPNDPLFHFQPWDAVQSGDPRIAQLLTNGVDDGAQRYANTVEENPQGLGALLTIGTAIRNIALVDGSSPLSFYWEVRWDLLAPDRFWAWVEADLAAAIKKMADLNAFAEEHDAAHWHPGIPGEILPATRSWKETRFDATNVQLSFHENNTAVRTTPAGRPVNCVMVEPDIDYYKDLLAHGLLEVLPNALTHGKTDPRTVYALRWMAAKQEGLPEFAPPCTVE